MGAFGAGRDGPVVGLTIVGGVGGCGGSGGGIGGVGAATSGGGVAAAVGAEAGEVETTELVAARVFLGAARAERAEAAVVVRAGG